MSVSDRSDAQVVVPPGAPASARRRRGAFALKLIVSAALLSLLFSRVSIREIAGLYAHADLGLVLLAHVLFAASIAGSAFQWGLFLRAQGITLPFRRLFGFYLVGLFFNNFLPANLGGDVVKVVDVARSGGSRGGAVAATLMDRGMGLLVLLVSGALAACAMGEALPFPEFRRPLYAGTIALAVVFAFLLSRRLLSRAAALAARAPAGWPARIAARLLAHAGGFQANRGVFLRALPVSIAIQALRIAVHYVAALALGVHVAPLVFLLVVPAIAIAVSLPISVGGFGVREGLGVVLFGRVGVGAPEALAFELLAHLIAVAVSAVGGVLFALRRRGV